MQIPLVDHQQNSLTAARQWVAAAAAGTVIAAAPRGLLCTTSGTITIEDEEAVEIAAMAVTAGVVYPLSPTKITAIAGGAVVWLLY